MLSVILAAAFLTATLQSESAVVGSLKRLDRGEPILAVGPIPLAGFNFWRRISLGQGRSAVVVSTLWESGIFFFGPQGHPLNVLNTAEVLRCWVVDLDRDGTHELVTEERLLRGTELLESEFRLYSATDRGRLLWKAESTAYAGPGGRASHTTDAVTSGYSPSTVSLTSSTDTHVADGSASSA